MSHPVTVCKTAWEKYRAVTMAGHLAALKDQNYQLALQLYAIHLITCPECRAELEKDGIIISTPAEPVEIPSKARKK